MKKVTKLTPAQLKDIVLKEAKDMLSKKAKEVGADKLADTLEKKMDHYAHLTLKEQSLRKELKAILEEKKKVAKSLSLKK